MTIRFPFRSSKLDMKSIFSSLLLCLAASLCAHGQYYYQDIDNARHTMEEHALYQRLQVHHVRIRSFDYNHDLNKDFHCTREMADGFRRSVTRTSSFQTGNSVIISDFDDSGRVVSTLDSSAESVNVTRYHYDSVHPERIDSLVFISSATKYVDTFRYSETHIYRYDASGRLSEIIREKNGALFSTIAVETDSAGNVTKEAEHGKYDDAPPVYYKYNARNQVTDIFHYNKATRKLEPDYLFDYDDQGRLAEKTVVTMNTGGYLLWKYHYDEKGLVASEACYGKKEALQGTMEFEYTF